MELPEPEEIPVFDEATERLLHAARVATAAGDARRGYREAVEGLVSAAMGLPGCRFAPTGEELIKSYLQKKVSKEPMTPVAGMREANVSLHNPMTLSATLPDVGEREWYFFTPRDRKYRHGVRPNRKTEGGFWKATGADKAVRSSEGETIGFKRSLVFNLGEHERGRHVKTDWIMYEYRLNQPPRIQESDQDMRLDDWVLCSIHDQPRPHAQRVAAKRRRKAVDMDVNPYYDQEPLQQYAQSTSVEAEEYGYEHQYLEEQQQLPALGVQVLEQEQYVSSSSSVEAAQYSTYQQYHQYLEQHPTPLINNNAATSTGAEQYCRSYQQNELEPLPSLSVVLNNRVVEQEYYAYLELQQNTRVEAEQYGQYLEQLPNTNTSVEAVTEQYGYQHGQYQYPDQYLEQQQPLPSLDALVIDEQEQYARVETREQYRYLEQHPMPLINKEQLITPDNSIPQPGVGFEFDWIKDFFDLSELIDDNYINMSSNQIQSTKGEAAVASIHSHSQLQQQGC